MNETACSYSGSAHSSSSYTRDTKARSLEVVMANGRVLSQAL